MIDMKQQRTQVKTTNGKTFEEVLTDVQNTQKSS